MSTVYAHGIHRTIVTGLVLAAAVGVAAAAPVLARTAARQPVQARHIVAAAARPVFSFGGEGGFMVPVRVTIFDDGTVKLRRGMAPPSLSHVQVARDTLDGLLKLATAEGFFSLTDRTGGRPNPDIGGRFITVYTTAGTKTVHVRGVRVAAFDQLYAVLSAVGTPATTS